MTSWINRSVAPNTSGTATTVTYNFTAASAGSLLVAVCGGPVTWTTPSGWSLLISEVNNDGLYVFTKTASAAESSFTSTHNGTGGANYPDWAVVYEFPAGSSINASIGTATANNGSSSSALPTLTGLTGTNTILAAVVVSGTAGLDGTCVWSTLTPEQDLFYNGVASDPNFFIGYADGITASTFAQSYSKGDTTGTNGGVSAVQVAINVAAGGGSTASGSITLSGSVTAQAAATASGSITLGGSVTPSTTAGGTLALSGAVSPAAAATATATLTLGGTVAAGTTAGGTIALAGAVTPQAPATATGTVTLTGSASTGSTRTATGDLTLTGAITGTAQASTTGALTLAGVVSPVAQATTAGALTLTGVAAATVGATLTAFLSLTATATALTGAMRDYWFHAQETPAAWATNQAPSGWVMAEIPARWQTVEAL